MKFNNSLPYSQASENNKIPILKVFKQHLKDSSTLLEIGGGTGQHAAFFSDIFKTIHWQSTVTKFTDSTDQSFKSATSNYARCKSS
jgi:protein-L-isoaspartate O-methyltransferase